MVVEELQAVGLHGCNLRGTVELLADVSLYLRQRHLSASVVLRGVVPENHLHRLQAVAVHIGGEGESLVAQRHLQRVLNVGGDDYILRHSDERHGHFELALHGFVECHEQPERTTHDKKEQKNQKLSVHDTEQKVLDEASYFK